MVMENQGGKVKKIFLIAILIFSTISCSKKETKVTNGISENDEMLITIYASNGSGEGGFLIKSFGHAFIAIKNVSKEDILLGNYNLKPEDEITFGAWGIDDHFGIWYDIEAQYQAYASRYEGIISLTTGIDIDKLDIINKYINEHDEWTFFHNCTYFARTLWNEVVDENEKLAKTFLNQPKDLFGQLKRFEEKEFSRKMTVHEYAFWYDEGEIKQYKLEEKAYD